MTSSIAYEPKLKTEALNIILREIARMMNSGTGYCGLSFRHSASRQYDISVLHRMTTGGFMGQTNEYPESMWDDISLAMYILAEIAPRNWHRPLVHLSEDHTPAWASATWHIDFGNNGNGRGLALIETLAQRADEVFTLLRSPLQLPVW